MERERRSLYIQSVHFVHGAARPAGYDCAARSASSTWINRSNLSQRGARLVKPSKTGRADGHRRRCSKSRRATSVDRPTLKQTKSGSAWSSSEQSCRSMKRVKKEKPTYPSHGVDVARSIGLRIRFAHEVPQSHLRAWFQTSGDVS